MAGNSTRRRRLAAFTVTLTTVASIGLGLTWATVPASATTEPPPLTSIAAPLPADAAPGSEASMIAISCGAPGWCVAVGGYDTARLQHRPLVEVYSAGSWHATRGPGIATGADDSSMETLTGVSCAGSGPASGVCVASGRYDTSVGFLDSFVAGKWSAKPVPLPADSDPTGVSGVSGVACAPSGRCVAVGLYTAKPDHHVFGLIDTLFVVGTRASWSAGRAPLPDSPPGVGASDSTYVVVFSLLSSVSCSGPDTCVAVGRYAADDGTGLGFFNQGLIETINKGTPSAAWAGPVAGEENDYWHGVLSYVGCGHGSCAGTGDDMAIHAPQDQLLETWSGGQFTPSLSPWPDDVANPPSGNLRASSCGATGFCVVVGDYAQVGNVTKPLILMGTTWSAIEAPLPADAPGGGSLGAVSCSTDDTCAAVTTGLTTPSDVIETYSDGAWTARHAPTPATSGTGNVSGLVDVGCDATQHCFAISPSVIVAIGSAPSVNLISPAVPFTRAGSVAVSWIGAGVGAPITRYSVQERHARWNGTFNSWWTPSGLGSLPADATYISAALRVGSAACFRIRAIDSNGHSTWSTQRCTERPLDDASLSRSSGWTRETNANYYRGTYTVTTHGGATLTRAGAHFDQVALLAETCPTCGTVAVSAENTSLGRVNLHSSTTKRTVIFPLRKVSLRTATITLKVTTDGKTVKIDGLGIHQT